MSSASTGIVHAVRSDLLSNWRRLASFCSLLNVASSLCCSNFKRASFRPFSFFKASTKVCDKMRLFCARTIAALIWDKLSNSRFLISWSIAATSLKLFLFKYCFSISLESSTFWAKLTTLRRVFQLYAINSSLKYFLSKSALLKFFLTMRKNVRINIYRFVCVTKNRTLISYLPMRLLEDCVWAKHVTSLSVGCQDE